MRSVIIGSCLAVTLACGSDSPAAPESPSTVTSILGDADGFGIGIAEGGTRPASAGLFPDSRTPGDPLFTDVLLGLAPVTYTHEFEASARDVISAVLKLMTFGVQDGDTQVPGSDNDIKLFVDGTEVPGAFDTVDQFFFSAGQFVESAGAVIIPLPATALPGLRDGRAVIRLETLQLGTSTNTRDAWAIDFSELTVTR